MTKTYNKFLDTASKDIENFLDAAKAQDISIIDLADKSSIADFMVIASGTSSRHVKALSEKLKEFLHQNNVKDVKVEGSTGCDWILIDTGDIIIHLFKPETREFYSLEKMWTMEFKPSDSSENTA